MKANGQNALPLHKWIYQAVLKTWMLLQYPGSLCYMNATTRKPCVAWMYTVQCTVTIRRLFVLWMQQAGRLALHECNYQAAFRYMNATSRQPCVTWMKLLDGLALYEWKLPFCYEKSNFFLPYITILENDVLEKNNLVVYLSFSWQVSFTFVKVVLSF